MTNWASGTARLKSCPDTKRRCRKASAETKRRCRKAIVAESKRDYGTESPSIRIPPRRYQAVEVALVRRARLRQTAAGRREAEGRAEGQAQVGGRQLD